MGIARKNLWLYLSRLDDCLETARYLRQKFSYHERLAYNNSYNKAMREADYYVGRIINFHYQIYIEKSNKNHLKFIEWG